MALASCSSSHRATPTGVNPDPMPLHRPPSQPLTAVAQLGRRLFFDPRLSHSGQLACATCHDPHHAFGPPDSLAVQLGGPAGRDEGARAVPSLRYLDRMPNFGIGPASGVDENVNLVQLAQQGARAQRSSKAAHAISVTVPMVPQGGLFWDGRVNTLQHQAAVPLFNPVEMANTGILPVATRLRRSYGAALARLFGAATISTPQRLIDEAMFAVARYEIEDRSFHPYSSKYDAYLEGRATLDPSEARGLAAFDDPARGNCAGCHLDRPGRDGTPPALTDMQYEALGVPRNRALAQNRDSAYYDLGLCGPIREDLASQAQYCGMFRTPSLRNVATRRVFFHNGVYHSLRDVLRFYNLRAVQPAAIYPIDATGHPALYDDIPGRDQGSVDTLDAPFDRHVGDAPPMTDGDIADIIAFLRTLSDGYHPDAADSSRRR
jgi:cytochrome c peroxidase